MFKKLLPKEVSFYEFFEEHSKLTVETAELLVKMAKDYDNLDSYGVKIKKLEKEMDTVTHKCIESLLITFITPIERTDIHKLINTMDDIPDGINCLVQRLIIYKIKSVKKVKNIRPEFHKVAEIILKQVKALQEAIGALRNTKKVDFIKGKCEIVRLLEKEADDIFKDFMAEIFVLDDCKEIIKWKEIFEMLEDIPNSCENVANIIEQIVISVS